jgi:transcriptional regulator with XRE-family HTH domain
VRVRKLRAAKGLTQEKLSYEFESGSKGYVSDLERGLVVPGLEILDRIAAALDVELLDLFVTPGDGPRHDLVDATRAVSNATTQRRLSELTPRLRR